MTSINEGPKRRCRMGTKLPCSKSAQTTFPQTSWHEQYTAAIGTRASTKFSSLTLSSLGSPSTRPSPQDWQVPALQMFWPHPAVPAVGLGDDSELFDVIAFSVAIRAPLLADLFDLVLVHNAVEAAL